MMTYVRIPQFFKVKEVIMSSKVMVIISTAEKDKALTGILYAKNAQKNKWIDDIRVIFFGPFENLVCEDQDVIQAASELLDYQTPIACKFLSDKSGASDKLEELGFNVEYVGALISDSIKAGYVPMVF
jgi:hypothetical protein